MVLIDPMGVEQPLGAAKRSDNLSSKIEIFTLPFGGTQQLIHPHGVNQNHNQRWARAKAMLALEMADFQEIQTYLLAAPGGSCRHTRYPDFPVVVPLLTHHRLRKSLTSGAPYSSLFGRSPFSPRRGTLGRRQFGCRAHGANRPISLVQTCP